MRPVSKVAITVLVLVHLGTALWHGEAHAALAIDLSQGKTAFVVLVIFLAPLVAASLVWTRHALVGVWAFLLSMFGGLVFGVYHHYMIISPDNIAHLPPGSSATHFAFITSAGALALLESASTICGALILRSLYENVERSHGARCIDRFSRRRQTSG